MKSRTRRPEHFCSLHERALAALTGEWQSFPDLKKTTELEFVAFCDLRFWGYAEERRELIVRHGIPCGERIFVRLAVQA